MLVIDLSRATVGVGGTATATVTGVEIPVGTDLSGLFGFGFEIVFDGAGLSAGTPVINTGLWTGNTAMSAALGSVGATANRVGESSGPSGSVVLASIVFEGLVEGDYQLQLGPLTGPGDNVLFDGTCLDATDVNCSVENSAFFGSATLTVPEPRWAVLLLTAAAWQFGVRWSRSRRR